MKIVPFKMDRLSGRRTLLFGLLAMLLGIIVIINGAGFTKLALDLLSLDVYKRQEKTLTL